MTRDGIPTEAELDVLRVLATPGTRWHLPAAVGEASGLGERAARSVLACLRRQGLAIRTWRRIDGPAYGGPYSITIAGAAAIRRVEEAEAA